MKLRYTPLQHNVLSVEEEDSPYHEVFREVRRLDGMPVIACALHSHVEPAAAVLFGNWRGGRSPRVVYVMTEGAALPIALSESVAQMKSSGLLAATITVGNAFGGDFEAVSIHSALVAARHVAEADVAIVGMGPGITGTASALGFSGLEQGVASDAAAALGGRSVFVPRVSAADPRARHLGLSHHTLTCLSLAVHRPTILALPEAGPYLDDAVSAQLAEAHVPAGADIRWVESAVEKTRRAITDLSLDPRSMGRGFEDDPVFFAAAGAAALVAAEIAGSTEGVTGQPHD